LDLALDNALGSTHNALLVKDIGATNCDASKLPQQPDRLDLGPPHACVEQTAL
jgi:hypothetical protein